MKHIFFITLSALGSVLCKAQTRRYAVTSPDKKITVTCDPAQSLYNIRYRDEGVLGDSKLGIIRDDEDFSKNLQVVRVSALQTVKDPYSVTILQIQTGK